jgi:hypothetical protein
MKPTLERMLPEEMPALAEKIVGLEKLLGEAAYLCGKGRAYVARQNDEPFLVGGIYPLWTGVAEAWVLHRVGFKCVPCWTLRTFRKIVNEAFRDMGIHRLQIDFSVKDHVGFGMSKAAGFEPEGTMRAFTYDRQDRLRMAIVRLRCP